MKTAFTVCVTQDYKTVNISHDMDGPQHFYSFSAALHVKSLLSSGGGYVAIGGGMLVPYVRESEVEDDVSLLNVMGEVVS